MILDTMASEIPFIRGMVPNQSQAADAQPVVGDQLDHDEQSADGSRRNP